MRIPLTNSKRFALVDDDDAERVLAAGPWRLMRAKRTFYARHDGKQTNGKWSTILLHRFVFGVNDPKIQIDHRNRNGLNCHRKNLRVATPTQNSQNSRKRRGTSSQYRGVSYHKQWGWRAYISVMGNLIHLGYFPDELSAALVYDDIARALHGDFANINFPQKKRREMQWQP